MRATLGQIFFAGVLSFLTAPQTTAPAKSDHTVVLNTPQHSPEQLDFGGVAEGETALRTFSVTTNSSGSVSVTITPGPFHLVEFREIGPTRGKSGRKPPATQGSDLRSRIRYRKDQAGPFQWSMDANVQIQIDIVLSPRLRATPGEQSALMNVNGPGPHGNWVLTVPLRGNVVEKSSPRPGL